MKVLITGASGFIGGFLVEEALQKGWEVWAGVRKTSDKRYLSHPSIHFIELDFANKSNLALQLTKHRTEFGRWDYIIHNAGVTKCMDVSDFDKINFQYTTQFVQALQESHCIPIKFLFMSSLGAVGPGDSNNLAPVKPDDAPNPISAYGRSKWKAETHLRELCDFPWLILRPTGVYGPRERDYFVMIKMIKLGFDFSVGFQPQMLDFIYVKDLARVCVAALESNFLHKTWFVADGDFHSSEAFSKRIRQALRKRRVVRIRVPFFLVECMTHLSELMGKWKGQEPLLNYDKLLVMKQRNWTCDATDLWRDLSMKPNYNLESGLEETVSWYLENGWLKK